MSEKCPICGGITVYDEPGQIVGKNACVCNRTKRQSKSRVAAIIAKLEKEREERIAAQHDNDLVIIRQNQEYETSIAKLSTEIAEKDARIAELEAALKMFGIYRNGDGWTRIVTDTSGEQWENASEQDARQWEDNQNHAPSGEKS